MNRREFLKTALLGVGATALGAQGCTTMSATQEQAAGMMPVSAEKGPLGRDIDYGPADAQEMENINDKIDDEKTRVEGLVQGVEAELPNAGEGYFGVADFGVGVQDSGWYWIDFAERLTGELNSTETGIASMANTLQQLDGGLDSIVTLSFPNERPGGIERVTLFANSSSQYLAALLEQVQEINKNLREKDVVRATLYTARGASPADVEDDALKIVEKPYRDIGRRVLSVGTSALTSEIVMGQPLVGVAANLYGQAYDLSMALFGAAYRGIRGKDKKPVDFQHFTERGLGGRYSGEDNPAGLLFYKYMRENGFSPVNYVAALGKVGGNIEAVILYGSNVAAAYQPEQGLDIYAVVEGEGLKAKKDLEKGDHVTGMSLMASERIGRSVPLQAGSGVLRSVVSGYGGQDQFRRGVRDRHHHHLWVLPVPIPGHPTVGDANINGTTDYGAQ